MGREPVLYRIAPLTPWPCGLVVLCGISSRFQLLSPCIGLVVHALLTRPPLASSPKEICSFDLHGLRTPPAFVLSQDQTLMFNPHPQLRRPLRLAKALASYLVKVFHSFEI